ncbi:MAG: clan AA aspartic protease [Methylococcales bacterium]
MGLTYVDVEVENLFSKRTMQISALVDSGAVFFTVPEHIAVQLGFDITEVSTREVELANGHRQVVPMIGPLRVKFAERYCDLSALVLGNEPLFGAVPMEMMDLVLNPASQKLTVNPVSPYVPLAKIK